jgi:hypothetical protein
MARITFSLPDELEQRLQAYATQNDQPISHVVVQALQAFLDGSRPTPGGPPQPVEDIEVREYLSELYTDLASLRRAVEEIAGIVPPALRVPSRLTRPPWKRK